MTRYAKPVKVDEALALLAQGRWKVLAGGTDVYPALGSRPLRDDLLDISGLSELRGLEETPDGWRIGACTSWSDIVRAPLPPAFATLQAAAREVGSIQIQNVATVAGNLCNASPAADGVPPLLALDAEVELRSAAATRRLPLSSFILGNRRTALRDGELLAAVLIPKRSAAGRSAFFKLGARRYLVISIAMAAVRLEFGEDRRITHAAIAVGACSPVAKRLAALEEALLGLPADTSFETILNETPLAELAPIDDVRGSARYRLEAAREIVARALRTAASPAAPEVQAA